MHKQTGNIISPEFYSALQEKAVGDVKLRRELNDYIKMALEPTEQQLKRGRVGRNEPCPCNSGKKFKNCCYRN
jgi:preprotein translocase subunit SecA